MKKKNSVFFNFAVQLLVPILQESVCQFAENFVIFSAFCGNLWLIFGGGFELLYSRVVRKLAAIVEWPGLSGLSIQWCFCENANFKGHDVGYCVWDIELLE